MSLIESKYWKCKQCGEFSIRLLFAPLVSNMQEVISFADSNQHQYDSEYCEVWLIGSPMDQGSEDSLYLT